ncbi:MAG: MarR family transcriptional regulator [Candidatus Omnitrophota bacterium]
MDKSLNIFSKELLRIFPKMAQEMFKRTGTDDLTKGKISIPQFVSMDLIYNIGQLKMKDIARQLNRSLPAATGLINRLYGMKMVRRVYDETDRRVIYITLTAKGRKSVEAIRTQREKIIKDIFGKLSVKERDDYLAILKKLNRIIYQENDAK